MLALPAYVECYTTMFYLSYYVPCSYIFLVSSSKLYSIIETCPPQLGGFFVSSAITLPWGIMPYPFICWFLLFTGPLDLPRLSLSPIPAFCVNSYKRWARSTWATWFVVRFFNQSAVCRSSHSSASYRRSGLCWFVKEIHVTKIERQVRRDHVVITGEKKPPHNIFVNSPQDTPKILVETLAGRFSLAFQNGT